MAAITICSDFGTPKNKVWHYFHCFPIYFPWSDGTRCHDLSGAIIVWRPLATRSLNTDICILQLFMCSEILFFSWHFFNHLKVLKKKPNILSSWAEKKKGGETMSWILPIASRVVYQFQNLCLIISCMSIIHKINLDSTCMYSSNHACYTCVCRNFPMRQNLWKPGFYWLLVVLLYTCSGFLLVCNEICFHFFGYNGQCCDKMYSVPSNEKKTI